MGKDNEKNILDEYIEAVSENDIYKKMIRQQYDDHPEIPDLPSCDDNWLGFRGELGGDDTQPHGKLRKIIEVAINSRFGK